MNGSKSRTDGLRALGVPQKTIKRFRQKLKELWRRGRGRNLERFIRYELNPVLRGWINYFKLAETKKFAEMLDMWIRHRLRLIIWRQWKRGRTRYKQLIARGLHGERARMSAYNGFGAWWNGKASRMNDSFNKKYLDQLGLVNLLEILQKFRMA